VANKTDIAVRSRLLKLTRRLGVIIARYKRLDDPAYVEKTLQNVLNKQLKKYRAQLMPVVQEMFTGKHVDLITADALAEFVQSADKYLDSVKINKSTDKMLTNSIKKEFGTTAKSLVNGMIVNQSAKQRQFKALVISSETGAEEVVAGQVGDIWETLTDKYGQHDTVLFQSGKKIPLETYVDGKAITMTQEAANMVVMSESARNGISIVQFSSHRSGDSCSIHEGKFAFLTKAAKTQFIKDNPDITVAKSFHTVEQVRGDSTHMLKFNCRHRLIPAPIELFTPGQLDKVPESPGLVDSNREARLENEAIQKERAA